MNAMYYRVYELPWSAGAEEEKRFWRILRNVVIALALLGALLPLLPLPRPDRTQAPAIPLRLARVVIERQAPPPPPPPQVVEAAPPPPTPSEKPVVVPPTPRPQVDRVEQARRKAATSGLLQMQDQLADLRDNSAADKAMQTQNLSGAVGETVRAERSLITSVGKGSGGINTAALSRGYGGGAGALTGHATTQVTSPVGGTSDGAEVRRTSGSTRASRSREEIELVFDRNKSAIYALYSRALRDNPALQGKLVLEITIAPTGEVTACQIVSSDLKDPELERKLIARIKLFHFEEKDVEAITTTKPIDFFPA